MAGVVHVGTGLGLRATNIACHSSPPFPAGEPSVKVAEPVPVLPIEDFSAHADPIETYSLLLAPVVLPAYN